MCLYPTDWFRSPSHGCESHREHHHHCDRPQPPSTEPRHLFYLVVPLHSLQLCCCQSRCCVCKLEYQPLIYIITHLEVFFFFFCHTCLSLHLWRDTVNGWEGVSGPMCPSVSVSPVSIQAGPGGPNTLLVSDWRLWPCGYLREPGRSWGHDPAAPAHSIGSFPALLTQPHATIHPEGSCLLMHRRHKHR